MKHRFLLFFFIAGLALINSCQKEYSFENNESPSAGSLQSDVTGDCLPKTVAGSYVAGTALNGDSSYIEVQLDVTQAGSFTINTDRVNGIYFSNIGVFNTTGLNTVRLRGNGTPLVAGIHNFIVTYDSTECAVAVTTLPAGAGEPAVFTLDGAPGTCLSYTVNGTYIMGTPLTVSNTVSINVNVTTIGIYSISTAESNGMTFTGTGIFAATDQQIIVLNGSGIPDTAGNTPIPVTVGSSSCNFSINVVGASAFTVDCNSAFVNGTYEEGVALTAANTVDIDVNVTTPGGYNITGTINEMTFSASGNFATAGIKTITLAGSGTPAADGIFDVPLTGGSAACNFQVTVEPGIPTGTIDWQFTEGTTTYKGSTEDAIQTTAGSITVLAIQGLQDNGIGSFGITLSNTSGGISTGVYSGTAISGKFAVFVYTDGGSISWIGGPTFGSNLPVNLTVYNTTMHIVQGTFSGTVTDGMGNFFTISAGTFKANFP